MIILSASGISLSFGLNTVLSNISFSVNEGDKLGIIGVNGAGKTSLFRLITGEYQPDSGSIFLSKEKTIGLLTQNPTTELYADGETVSEHMQKAYPELLCAERRMAELEEKMRLLEKNGTDFAEPGKTTDEPDKHDAELEKIAAEYSELHRRYVAGGGLEFRSRCTSLLRKTGFDEYSDSLDTAKLSGGQRTRLALARILCREPDILLLDEPTNHLDIDTLLWLEDFLASYKNTVLVISHDRYFLDKVTNRTLVVERKSAALYEGNYTRAQDQINSDRASREKKYKQQQREIARIEAMIAQQRTFAMERNFITIRSKEKYIERMDKVKRPPPPPKDIRLSFSDSASGGNDVLMARRLSLGFGEKLLFSDLDFLIKKGERVFFVGPNGCGKSTLMKVIVGAIPPSSGVIEIGYNIKIGYYDQENQNLTDSNTVIDELWSQYPSLAETKIRNTLALFLFIGDDVKKPVSALSGGERARLTLAKLILSDVNLLIMDEPTNHLDISSREALESALFDFGGTVVAVSHDRYFIDRLATRIIEIFPGKIDGKYYADFPLGAADCGSYEEYRLLKSALISRSTQENCDVSEEKVTTKSKEDFIQTKKALSNQRKEERLRESYIKETHDIELETEKLRGELFGDAASDYIKAAEIQKRIDELEERLLWLYERTME